MIRNSYTKFIYWSSIAQSLARRDQSRGYYVLSYPKCGSNWMCHLLAGYFEIPVLASWDENFTVFQRRIYHLHRILPYRSTDARTVYMMRDGRDVIISYLFNMIRTPHSTKMRNEFSKLTGRQLAEDEIKERLPEFIDFLHEWQVASVNYEEHMSVAMQRDFHMVKFEDLKADPHARLTETVGKLTGADVDQNRVDRVVSENTFEKKKALDKTNFLREGRTGDWHQYFNRKSARKFWDYYGPMMLAAGYENDDAWIEALPES